MEKKVLIIIKSAPFTNLNYYEGLRTAAGLWNHQVSILWTGKGIHGALKEVDNTLTKKFLEDLPDLEVELFVDGDALKGNRVSEEDVIEKVVVADTERVSELIEEAEVSLVF